MMRPFAPVLLRRASEYSDHTAIRSAEGDFTYADLTAASRYYARRILEAVSDQDTAATANAPDPGEARIAYLMPVGFDHVAVQWGVWRAGGIAVPLALSHPAAELAHVLDDATPSVVVTTPELSDRLRALTEERDLPLLVLDPSSKEWTETEWQERTLEPRDTSADRRALMIYTSGPTGRPKGVVTTHGNLQAQVESLVEAWAWNETDRVLLVLPLHHVHGIVNVVTCALWSGACCHMAPRFDAVESWERIAQGDLTVFMAVPTIYVRMIRAWDEASPADRRRWSAGARGMRLMVSGSAALPVSVLERWQILTGQRLLERYGMTEIGMGLSNPLQGERRAGYVGQPLPGVEVRRVDDGGNVLADPLVPGELEVRGPGVFAEYWRRPEDTRAAHHDGWFRTGDVAVVEEGYYRLLGRMSVDIIKTSGHKVSALEVEEILRLHPGVDDCAVVGVPDPELGERVCCAVVSADPRAPSLGPIVSWASERLAPYKVPREVRPVEQLPRNSMGKVQKKAVRELFTPDRA